MFPEIVGRPKLKSLVSEAESELSSISITSSALWLSLFSTTDGMMGRFDETRASIGIAVRSVRAG